MLSQNRLRLPALLLLTLLLLITFGAIVWGDNAAHRGITFTPLPPPISGGSGPTLAVNFYNLHLEPDPAAVRRSFELARAMGARYGRMQVPWEDLEIHARGDFEDRRNLATVGAVSAWAKYDQIAAEANSAGIELIWRLDRPPAWARVQANATPVFQAGLARDGNSTGPPDNFADYGAFVSTVVERYDGDGVADAPTSPTVSHFQLWNEPNLRNEWGWEDPRPEDFAALLRIGAEAARAANPEAVILFPGLAPTDGLDPRAPMTELAYLDRVYRAGGAAYFDVLAAQAYGLGQPPSEHRYVFLRNRANWNWSRPVDTRNDVGRVVLLREVMLAHGDTATPVWVTEFGWNSAPASLPPERRLTWGAPVSETTKGDYLVGQLLRARDEWPWMGVMSIWMLRYGGYAEPDPNDPTPYFALISRDWELLPAYHALREFSAAPVVAGVGAHLWTHPAVEPISGGWRLRFSGTRLLIPAGPTAAAGPFEARLDGSPLNLVRSEDGDQQALATPELPDGVHTLELYGDQAPDLLLVERARPWGLLWDYGPLALLAALALGGAATLITLFPALERVRRGPLLKRLPPALPMLLAMLFSIALAYRASPQLPLTLSGLALFGGLALVRPDLALLFTPLTVPLYFIPKAIFDTRFGLREQGLALPLHELLLLIALAATALRLGWELLRTGLRQALHRAAAALTRPGLWRAVLRSPEALFVLAALWGVLIADARGPALRELRWLVLEPLLFIGAATLMQRRWLSEGRGDYWLLVVQFWLSGAAVAGLVGTLQLLGLNLAPLFGTKVGFSEDSVLVEGVRRAASLYGHPNNLGLAMGRAWPVAAALAHWAFWSAADRRAGLGRAWPYLLATLLSLAGLLASFSRGAYLGALVAAGVLGLTLLPTAIRRSQRTLVGLGVLAGLALLGLVLLAALDIERLNPFGASSGVRLATWASALAMLRDHPLGIGLDQFGRLYPDYIRPDLAGTNEINTAHPHNLLLDLALRMGPPGLLACAWLLIRLFGDARRAISQGGEGLRGAALGPALLAGVAAAMAAALTHGLVDQFYFWPDLALAFWLFSALGRAWRVSPLILNPMKT